jgi:MFS family permease
MATESGTRPPDGQRQGTPVVDGATRSVPQTFPTGPLAITLAVQILATLAAFSVPAVAPAISRDLGVPSALVGLYLSIVYGVGILSALLSPGLIYRYGAGRVSQGVLVATVAMVATASTGTLAMVVLSAVLMGLAYGATAPASTHLLVPRTPPSIMNLVISLRQIGVPVAGVLAGLLMPPMTLRWGWQTALALQIIPAVIMMVVLEVARRDWDKREAMPPGQTMGLLQPLRLLAGNPPLRRLSFASFVYSGLQGCFIAFMTTHLTTIVGFDLVHAGQALAVYQISGSVSRPIWGWLADHVLSARALLAIHGVIMSGAGALAAFFGPGWTSLTVFAVCIAAGATASGFTGLAFAEFSRLGGERSTQATGLGAAALFSGVMVLPAVMTGIVLKWGDYRSAYLAVAVMALVSSLALCTGRRDAA